MAKLPELTTLQDLFVEGENFSEYYLRKTNCLQPCLLFIGTEGAHLYVPELSTDLDALDTFVQHAALLCLAHAATISLLTRCF